MGGDRVTYELSTGEDAGGAASHCVKTQLALPEFRQLRRHRAHRLHRPPFRPTPPALTLNDPVYVGAHGCPARLTELPDAPRGRTHGFQLARPHWSRISCVAAALRAAEPRTDGLSLAGRRHGAAQLDEMIMKG